MASYLDVLIFSLLGGVISLVGGILLLRRKTSAEALAYYGTPFAAGALLAAVFLDLLPEGLAEAEASGVLQATLAGVLIFFLLERFLNWFHHHHEHKESGHRASVPLIIIGDTLHNALDGVAIATAFLVSFPVGVVTTIAVAAHEIPQEIGDFGLLLARGLRRRLVLVVNIMSALATTLMALLTFWLGSGDKLPLGALLGVSAGFLLYIACSDIIPSIHEAAARSKKFDSRPWLLLLGVLVVGLAVWLAGQFITE